MGRGQQYNDKLPLSVRLLFMKPAYLGEQLELQKIYYTNT